MSPDQTVNDSDSTGFTKLDEGTLSQTINQAAVGIAHVGMDGTFLRVNDRWCELSGYSREELTSKTFRDITHPDDLHAGIDLLEHLRKGEISHYSLNKRYIRKDGSILTALLTAAVHKAPDGEPLYYISAIQDAENLLPNFPYDSAAAARLSLHSLEVMGEAAVVIDCSGRIEDATSAFFQMGGYGRKELMHRQIDDILSSFCLSEGLEIRLVEGLQRWDREGRFADPLVVSTKSGEPKWVVPHVSNVLDADGQQVGRLLTLRDVTALKEAQLSAFESERKYRQLVEHANSIILRVDTDFTIRFANEYARNFFGYEKKTLAGRSLLQTLAPKKDPSGQDLHSFLRQVMAKPEICGSYDQQNRCRTGEWVWVHWSVRAVRDEKGEVQQLLCVGTDITERKHAEVRAEWYRRRSRRLADQLITTEEKERSRMAEYLHDQIIQMLSLSNIRLGGVHAEVCEAGLEKTAERVTGIRTLLDDAIAECRQMMDQLVPPLLYELGLAAAVQHLAEKHQTLDGTEILVDDQLGSVAISRELAGLLFRSVRELLMNALKYAGPCRVTVTLEKNKKGMSVRVEDNGCGFNPFEKEGLIHDSGHGFGLFTVRERLEGVGGTLQIQSEPGRGTAAMLWVPLETCSFLAD